MPKYEKIKNNCKHEEQINKIQALNKYYFYCFECNHIILIHNNKPYSLYKLIQKDEEDKNNNDKLEFDPITSVKLMIQRQDEQIKEINDKLVLNFANNENKENDDKKNNNNEFINEENNNEKNKEGNKNQNNKGKEKTDNENNKNEEKKNIIKCGNVVCNVYFCV